MPNRDWKNRFAAEIKASGKSLREISRAAGKGDGYVHSVIGPDNKDPTVENFLKVCEVAEISPYKVLGGYEITPEKELLLGLLDRADDELLQSVLVLLGRGRPNGDIPIPQPGYRGRQLSKLK